MQAQAATPCFAGKVALAHPSGVSPMDVRMYVCMDHVTHVTVHGAPEHQDTSGMNMQILRGRAHEQQVARLALGVRLVGPECWASSNGCNTGQVLQPGHGESGLTYCPCVWTRQRTNFGQGSLCDDNKAPLFLGRCLMHPCGCLRALG